MISRIAPRLAAPVMAACLALTAIAPQAAQADDTPKLVTIITSADPQAQLMGMVLTMQAARQGAETQILLCGTAGDIALRDAPETATAPQPPRGMSPQGLMQTIMAETDTTTQVCAIYLPGKGVGAEALIDGVTAAAPDTMAAALLADDVRLLSF